jgi:thymidylate synthase
MKVLKALNVHEALPKALLLLFQEGIERDSRNGKVLVYPTPVTTVYEDPTQRVIFWAERDANPFFHFFESLWMLNGNNDVGFVSQFVKRMRTFSDNGKTFHGAYGYRWRRHFNHDQLSIIIDILKKNPDDRRCVLQIWDAQVDLGKTGKDFPCNTQVYFSRDVYGHLDMTVCNRSNDIIWGCYGANAVHFSFLQEFVASSIGCKVGKYYQVSNNWHGYLETIEPLRYLSMEGYKSPYEKEKIKPFPIMSVSMEEWQQDLSMFINVGLVIGFKDPFFKKVVTPMYNSFLAFKNAEDSERFETAHEILEDCAAEDWRIACQEWILRREENFNQKGINQ